DPIFEAEGPKPIQELVLRIHPVADPVKGRRPVVRIKPGECRRPRSRFALGRSAAARIAQIQAVACRTGGAAVGGGGRSGRFIELVIGDGVIEEDEPSGATNGTAAVAS